MHILDAIDRRGSFAAAANELDRAPSSLSYQIQKLEQDLDIMIFDRSGHKASFTQAGKLILERGRVILSATEKLVNDASVLANGWELDMTLAYDGIVSIQNFFPLVDALGNVSSTRIRLQEILAGCWESLDEGRADLLVCTKPDTLPLDVKSETIGALKMIWVAAPTTMCTNEMDHLTKTLELNIASLRFRIPQESNPLSVSTYCKNNLD